MNTDYENKKITIVGLGYVGLPLALAFSKKYPVVGYDINPSRIEELKKRIDQTDETNPKELHAALENGLQLTNEIEAIADATIYIVTVPTPVNENKEPDLSFLLEASKTIGSVLKSGDLVIYESTTYPGCTEEDCVPVLEKYSKLKFNHDFFCGYSPERINPGDKVNTLTKIKKVTSGSIPLIAEYVDQLYKGIIEAGTYKASSIKVAEASKAIENAQRDLNISFVNELALIFDRIGIDTREVLEAAGTKWNFLKFTPGLVGGHCISVDPYYLTHKAKELGYDPQVILSGRKINDYMPSFVAQKMVKLMGQKGIPLNQSRCLILGITFKENCPDIRNSKIPQVVRELEEYGITVYIHDSHADSNEVKRNFNIELIEELNTYDSILLAVNHKEYKDLKISELKRFSTSVVFDLKGIFPMDQVDARL
ncbi:MAG: nucleotide sugar dehydrogenase [Flavobacteriaceae bacterium]|jgi:UDP-N-acetyl-D-galactosamine dehydrogenase|nr:nucleotide sugar dehydrogenase [Flavobacteriaceae bacterium]NVJ72988.1 nucleotide sugar dehydrogenase [Flavobacteriaceae bacterium]